MEEEFMKNLKKKLGYIYMQLFLDNKSPRRICRNEIFFNG